VAAASDCLLAEVRAENHGTVVGGFGYDGYRPRRLLPVDDDVRDEFNNGPITFDGGGDGLTVGLVLSQHSLAVFDELPQAPMPPDLAGVGVVNDHLTRPNVLQIAGVTAVERDEVLPNRISSASVARLPAY
jgi:hypothetical protein